nr:PREDICTED: complement decay-accelerating factor isoform X3 [Equus przewalskii]
MSPARRSAPTVLRLLGWLPVLLLLCPPAARGEWGSRDPARLGDCSHPPDVPNAQPTLGELTSFPKQTTVTYKCDEGFVKVPGKPDSVVCLENDKWSEVAEFCNRSCDVPPRLPFASLQNPYRNQNYFPAGSTVEYECRMGYRRDRSLSGTLTCLQNFTWSKPDEFCKKKACPTPGEIPNGHVKIQTDILFGAAISFSCNTGYTLVGSSFSYCSLEGENVKWTDPLPECKEIACPSPPAIANGIILEQHDTYIYRQSITYKCEKGFTLVGGNSIHCTVKDGQGEWSGPPPECKDSSQISKVTPAVQKPTTVDVTATEAPSTPQKTSAVNVTGTEAPSPPQKTSAVNVTGTEAPSTPQKTSAVNVPTTEAPSTPQKPTTINSSATKSSLIPQRPSIVDIPATEAPSTPQKPTTIHSSAMKFPLIPQRPTIVDIPATEAPSTPQKPTTIHSSATKFPLIPQKPSNVNIPATETPSTPQKPTAANVSATTAEKSPISNSLSAETPPAAQNPIVANASATQFTPVTQRLNTAKASFTQSLPGTRKSTAVHAPVTKHVHTKQRLTSAAHITATQNLAVPSTTTRFHTTSTSKGAVIIASGIVAGTVIVTLVLVKIFLDRGKSGMHMYNIDSLAYDASNYWLADLAKEELRRKCIQVYRTFLVS